MLDEPDAIRKKFRARSPIPGSEVARGPGKEGIANLIEILAVVRGVDPEAIEDEFDGSGYGDFKARGRRRGRRLPGARSASATRELRADEAELERVLAAGAEKARAIAAPTLADVREAMGVGRAA